MEKRIYRFDSNVGELGHVEFQEPQNIGTVKRSGFSFGAQKLKKPFLIEGL